MMVFLNGRFVPEDQAMISVFDRGFLYGDGVYETLRIYRGKPFRWAEHWERLERGAALLRLPLPENSEILRLRADELIRLNRQPEAALRIVLSRGSGPRGYSPRGAGPPSLVMSLHPAPVFDPAQPPVRRLATASLRVAKGSPLAAVKHGNRLVSILARAEAEAQVADDALLLNEAGEVAEATSANVFWIKSGAVGTPPIEAGALPGVTRALVMELCGRLRLACAERSMGVEDLRRAEGVFLTSSVMEIVEVSHLDGHELRRSPLTVMLRAAYAQAVQAAG